MSQQEKEQEAALDELAERFRAGATKFSRADVDLLDRLRCRANVQAAEARHQHVSPEWLAALKAAQPTLRKTVEILQHGGYHNLAQAVRAALLPPTEPTP